MKLTGFAKYAWGVLGYNVLVILWGAFVRATGSGAGCGRHWPLCDGEVIPRAPDAEKVVEFTHRAMSGLALVLVVGLIVWAYRRYPHGHRVRFGARLALIFIIIEALVGAGLVLFELVAGNDSMARAVVIALHLANTFLLLGSLVLTALWASGTGELHLRGRGRAGWLVGLALAGVMLIGVTGAITALGDTLFPAGSLVEGMQQDLSPTAHFLLRLRVYHPLIAIVAGIYVALAARYLAAQRARAQTTRLAKALTVLVVIQLIVGAFNVALLAPVWMQIVHLLLADLVWITLVLFGGTLFAEPATVAQPSEKGAKKLTLTSS